MSARNTRHTWLPIAVKAQRFLCQDRQRALAEARQAAHAADTSLVEVAAEAKAVLEAWLTQRHTKTATHTLDQSYQRFHAYVMGKADQAQIQADRCAKASESALADLRQSFARQQAIEAFAERVHKAHAVKTRKKALQELADHWTLRTNAKPGGLK